jgi:hypothetical protein
VRVLAQQLTGTLQHVGSEPLAEARGEPGQGVASWESSFLRIVSSDDSESIAERLADPACSNEGPFAYSIVAQTLGS